MSVSTASVASTTGQSGQWLVEPFTMSAPDQFGELRGVLMDVGYDEPRICERAKVGSIYDLVALPIADTPIGRASDPLSAFVHLFFAGATLPWVVVEALLEPGMVQTLRSFGLLMSLPSDESVAIAPLAIYPVAGLMLASDRTRDVRNVANGLPGDMVYSALTPDSRQFVTLMPRGECEDHLDLCAGTGIGALIAAKSFAKRSTAIDLTERATRFARFNAMLNGVSNVSMLQGDLFEAVKGQTFDMIVSHPPYVPSVDDAMVYRDGGDDGERVTRRILSEMPQYLRPGGSCFCRGMMTDRKGKPIEHRVRSLLGSAQGEFDVFVAHGGELGVAAHVKAEMAAGRMSKPAAEQLLERFAELGIERFLAIGLMVRRRAAGSHRPIFTHRRVATPRTRGIHLEWYLRWLDVMAECEREPLMVLDAKPRAVEGVEASSHAVLEEGRWVVGRTALSTHWPLAAEGECPSWIPWLLASCDGTVTVRAHFERLHELDLVGRDFDQATFANIVLTMTDAGFLELDLCPIPR